MKGRTPAQSEYGHSFLTQQNQLLLMNVHLTLILAANQPERQPSEEAPCLHTDRFFLFLLLECTTQLKGGLLTQTMRAIPTHYEL